MDIVSLIQGFVSDLLKIEENFFQEPEKFENTERDAKELGDRTVARFLSMLLTEADEMIQRSSLREKKYDIQRHKQRTLVSTVGDINFIQTTFRDRDTGEYRALLPEMIHLPPKERFTTMGEAKTLSVAEVRSYQYAADSMKSDKQTISKVTVMNKVHKIEENISEFEETEECEKRVVDYLYIEADEDHIHRQKTDDKDGCIIGILAYLFEGKEDVCAGKRQLVKPFYIYKDKLLAAEKMLTRIKNRFGGENAVEDCRTYFRNNWEAIQRAFHDKNVLGCSAEGHVSNVYSDRMSSRPMGWSEIGSDRMCKLRCFVRNYGRERIADLVKFRREKELNKLQATGTDGIVESLPKKDYSLEQRRAYAYIERMQATLGGNTVKKTLAIRNRLNDI